MYTIRRFENWGVDGFAGPLSREVVNNLAPSSAQKVFGTVTGWQRNNRQGVSLCFLSTTATDTLFIRIVPRGTSATPSATNCDYVIAANQTVPIHCGPGVDIYVLHTGTGNKTYTASEFA